MGRKSKLNEKQWAKIQERMIDGEAVRALAREFNVSESAIRAKKTARVEKIKDTANQVVKAECAVKSLDLDAQQAVSSYAATLRAVSDNLMGAALNGSVVSNKLSAIAVKQLNKIDAENPMESQEELQAIAALNKLGGDASAIGLNLIKINNGKDEKKEEPKDTTIILNFTDAVKPDEVKPDED